jgi:CRISPR-associated endonuclease/helicase Cas3
MVGYFAHSENDQKEKHRLAKHLHETARLAESFACHENYKPIFKLSGLLHDLGKYQLAFQNYLENGGRRGSVPHASWGAGYARKVNQHETSFVIDGHHKGLPDKAAWKSDTEPYKRGDVSDFDEIFEIFLTDNNLKVSDLQYAPGIAPTEPFHREIFTRYLFSALTDSDWLSTEGHFSPEKVELRTVSPLPVDEMIATLEEEFIRKPTEGGINPLRNAARKEATDKAVLPPGFYSLALPTGMGKTLTSLAWALRHAKYHGLKRIIVVLPYISIIDQTAQELKGIFGEELVLEHHSSYNEEQNKTEDRDEDCATEKKRKQLACENWDYPVIVTTTVQFFESLFSNKPSKCRKVHNIAEAVVIFDEVQSIPKEIILPTLRMLNDVQAVMRASFLFCTATQPAYEKRQGFDGIDAILPLSAEPGCLYDKTRRVEYRLLDELAPVDMARLSEAVVESGDSALVIFNTKKAALEFYDSMQGHGEWEMTYHLSTAMCPAHRKEVIKKIRADLDPAAKKKILVSSTQLIEAGVDFDFPVLFRAMAPLEALIQSAGRCNREGRLTGYGKVFLFKLLDGKWPNTTYAACAGFAEELIKADVGQLYKHDVFQKYYASVFALYIDQAKQQGINNARKEFDFATVNDSYRLIKDASEGLFIYNFSEESRQLLHSLQHKEFLSRSDYRKMQAYTVQVYEYFIFQNKEFVEATPHGFNVWYGNYDPATGISVAPMAADKSVV